jgi:hypothetical protein
LIQPVEISIGTKVILLDADSGGRKMNLQFDKMTRFYYDYMLADNIYHINVDYLIPEFPDACSTCALPYEDEHGELIGVAVQADALNPDYPGDGEPECINAGVKYFTPDHYRKVMVEVRP